jgi:hypothetical protein
MSVRWRVLLLIFGVLLVNLHLAVRQGEFALPIAVTLEGVGDEAAHARLFAYPLSGSEEEVPATRPGVWDCPRRCTVEVVLRFPERLRSGDGLVRLNVGDQAFTLPLKEFEPREGVYWLTEKLPMGAAPALAPCRNWPGTQVFLVHYLGRSGVGLAAVLLLVSVAGLGMRAPWRGRFASVLGLAGSDAPAARSEAPDALPVRKPGDRFWNWAGWLFLIGGFVGLESMQPYYFTQDDALIGELPGVVLGCRSLWAGTFPDWNPYVFMGAPLASIGFWAITYPPQLIAYAVARHLLGDEFATMEVFAALHLLAGFVAMRLLCRRIGMGACAANLAALSFVYAGCILIMGRSWHAFIANAVWLPLLGLGIQRFREGPVGWKWIVGVALVLGLAYHAGFPQIVAILGMFLLVGLAVVAYADRIPLRRLAAVVPALLLAVGLSAPLLLHHLQMTGGHERFVPAENGVYDELQAAVLPYPLAGAELPTHWGSTDVDKMGHFYFFGGLFALLFALQACCFWVYWPERRAWARCWWVPCGIFALLMILGEPAYLWRGVSSLPMARFFLRYTFRFYPCFAFCAVLAGGLILENVLATLQRRRPWELLVGSVSLAVLAYHLAMCQPSFYSYGFRPFPELPSAFESIFHPYSDKHFIGPKNSRRIASWGQFRSVSPDYYLSLTLNLPHYYQVPSIFGYDPVVEGQPQMAEVLRRLQENPAAACKAYGVGWHLFSYPASPVLSPNRRMWTLERFMHLDRVYHRLLKAQHIPLAEFHGTTVMEVPGVDPLAFVTGRPEQPLPLQLQCRGVDVDVSGLEAGTPVTVNFLWYPQMECTLDGNVMALDKDGWQRITATLSQTGSTLSVRFRPSWHKTCAAGAGICGAALTLAWLALRRRTLV